MHVRLEDGDEAEPDLIEELEVAGHVLAHRVDQRRFARRRIGEEVGERAGLAVEELAEDHRCSGSTSSTSTPPVAFGCTKATL